MPKPKPVTIYKNGRLHCFNGPAHVTINGDIFYYSNGNLHRWDGPAEIWSTGDIEYRLFGSLLHKDRFNHLTKNIPLYLWNRYKKYNLDLQQRRLELPE
jgi:hypothetical protein